MPRRRRAAELTASSAVAALGPTLALLRRVCRVTQAEVARASGISRTSVSQIENGAQVPKVRTLLCYLATTGTSLSQLGGLLQHVCRLDGGQNPPTPRQVAAAFSVLRRRARMDFTQLSQVAGIPRSTVTRLELQNARTSTDRFLVLLLDGLGATLEELQHLAEEEMPGGRPARGKAL